MIRFSHVILLLWLALTLVVVDSAPAPRAWVEWAPDACRLVNCYCEPIRAERFVAQPVVTYSNFGLILAGAFVLWAAFYLPAPRLASNRMSATRTYPLAYGAALVAVGAASFFYHASLTRVGDYFDLMGMYLFTSFIVLYHVSRLRPMRGVLFGAAYLALNLTLALGLAVAYDLQQVYFGGLAATALLTEIAILRRARPRIRWPLLVAALVCFGLGGGIWILDSRGLLPCAPSAPLTWHGLWHLAVAASAVLLFFYYRSEAVTQSQT